MKKVLLLLLVAAAFASCTKEASVSSLDSQKGRKAKTQALTVAVTTSVPVNWIPEDAIVSIDSANWVLENVGTGNNVYWSVRGDESLLPSYAGVCIQVWIEANSVDKFGATSLTSHWTAIGQDYYLTYAPGKIGVVFDGYPGQTETRIYRAQLIDKTGIVHYSSAYQVN